MKHTYNICLTNYKQNTYSWIFLTISYREKSKNAIQKKGEKYNIYLTDFRQNTALWTFFETMRVLVVSTGCQDSKNRNIFILFYSRQ